jgi:acyl-CoA synthetase (AMP-forming)/AMP-acid ligase II
MLAPLAPALVLRSDEIALARTAGRPEVAALPGLDADPFADVSYMHTSGTTGLPKFCVQTHDYFRRMATAMAAALDLRPSDRVLAPLPMFHINPMGYGIITALLTGADALTVARFSAGGFWPAVVSEQVSVLILHAPPVEILKRATTAEEAVGHRVRAMFYADAEFMRRPCLATARPRRAACRISGVGRQPMTFHRTRAGTAARDGPTSSGASMTRG